MEKELSRKEKTRIKNKHQMGQLGISARMLQNTLMCTEEIGLTGPQRGGFLIKQGQLNLQNTGGGYMGVQCKILLTTVLQKLSKCQVKTENLGSLIDKVGTLNQKMTLEKFQRTQPRNKRDRDYESLVKIYAGSKKQPSILAEFQKEVTEIGKGNIHGNHG